MIIFDNRMQKEYQKDDIILRRLEETGTEIEKLFTSHQWLLDSLPKRMIYFHVYKDLLFETTQRKKVIDVGGGYTSLTKFLVQYHDYTLLDIMAHCPHEELRSIQRSLAKEFWECCDWLQFNVNSGYDLVIANDLFPNVDQRLTLFLEKFIPVCREMRITLTYYNSPRWYKVQRLDGYEVYHMLAWDGIQVRRLLKDYLDRIDNCQLDLLLEDPPSLYDNKRQVCLITIRGDKR